MRVAQEVKKRMDEAQRELEKNALEAPRPHVDEEEDDDEHRGHGGDVNDDRRSVLEKDRDLLEGAEAEVIMEGKGVQTGGGGQDGTKEMMGELIDMRGNNQEAQVESKGKVLEFER